MAIGKITGQMLGDSLGNLARSGVDLSFDTDLIYLDVANRRVGIKTTNPQYELDVVGTTRTTNLQVTTSANISNIVISGNNIYSTTGVLNLAPASGQHVVYNNRLIVDSIKIEGNHIRTISSNASLDLSANGTGYINLNGNTEVFGNLHATGTITADGNLSLGDNDTDSIVFNADIASNLIPDVTDTYSLGNSSKRWNDVWVKNLNAINVNTGGFAINGIDITLPTSNTIYVSVNGASNNSGTHPQDPVDTIGRAIDLATAGDTIFIYPGVYQETLPLIVPAGVTIKGAGIRSVTVLPDSDVTVDMFLLNGECTIEDLTITGYNFDSSTNTGYAFRFAPNMTVTSRSPYIRNVTVITTGTVTSLSDPRGFLTGDAGKGAYIDGSIVNASSKEASMLFHSVTFICPGVDTITCINGVRVEWLNSFTYFADRSIYGRSGTLGFASDGKTRVKITNKTGTFAVGNTLTYYDVNGTTVLASGVIESIDGNFYVIDGKALGFQSLRDRDPKTVFANGNASLSTAQKKFGTASLYVDGTGDYISLLAQSDFTFGTGDYTVEFFVRPDSLGSTKVIYDSRTSGTDLAIYLEINSAGNIRFFFNGAYRITSSVACTALSWNHVALARQSGTTRLFVNGTLTPTTYADVNDYPSRPIRVGTNFAGASGFAGYIDDLKICKGAAKYTASYTVPTSALTGDNSTVLLLHFDGPNGSTTFFDDGVTLQDVRTSAGGTASIIDFADYSDFGCEIRSIASASVYGNYGVYGDGDGVIGYFIGHNMGYIGSGRFSNNDPTYVPDDSTNVNEVVKINRAQIYYSTVDNKGDFRVGEYFYINQRTGQVTFNQSDLTITSSTGITFTDGSNITEVTPTYLQTGNIKISGNTVESIVNGMTLTAANNQITATSDVSVTGTLTVDNNFTTTGNTIIGDSNSDLVTFNAEVISNFVPDLNTTFDLGSSTNQWNKVFLAQANIDDIQISGNLIRTTVSNSNLELRANGTGVVRIDQLDFNDNTITSNTVNTDIQITPNGTGTIQLLKDTSVTGNLSVSGNITLGGNITIGDQSNDTINIVASITNNLIPAINSTYNIGTSALRWRNLYASKLLIDGIDIDTNVIQSTDSNANLELKANGTGSIRIDLLDFKTNTISSNTTNTDININPNGTGTIQLQKDTSITGTLTVSGLTTLNANLIVGDANTDTITFNSRFISDISPNTSGIYNLGSDVLRWRNLFSGRAIIDNIEIDTNVIQTNISNQDLELRANGTGAVRIDLLDFKNNSIITNTTNTDININPNGTGTIQLQKDTNITGTLTVSQNVNLNGNTVIGDSNTDTINFLSRFINDLVPATTGVYNIGSDSLRWRNLYSSKVVVDNIEIDTNVIQTNVSNQDLELRANGTGAVRVDQIDFKTNTISTNAANTDLLITPNGSGTIQLQKDTTITGNLTVSGISTFNGNITVGDANTDTVTVGARIISNLVPNQASIYSLGTSTLRWGNLYTNRIVTDDIEIDTNYIRTTLSNQNLELRANGTGAVRVDYLDFKNSTISSWLNNYDITLIPNGTGIIQLAKDTNITGNLTVSGSTTLNGNIVLGDNSADTLNFLARFGSDLIPSTTATYNIGTDSLRWRNLYAGKVVIDSIDIDTNVIQSTESNANLELRANGSGSIRIDILDFKNNTISSNSTNADIGISPNGTGTIQLLKDTNVTGNLTVSGVTTLNGNTIIGDSVSDNLNVVGRFISDLVPSTTATYNLGTDSLRWRSLYTGKVLIDNIEIDTNLIQTTVSNQDLELRANGTGAVRIDFIDFKNNSIVTNLPNYDLLISPNGTGQIQLQKDTSVTGTLSVNGTTSLNGNTFIGDSVTDTVNYTARFLSDLVPSLSATYNLGTDSLRWRSLYAGKTVIDSIEIDTNLIQTTVTNQDLELRANGTGSIRIDQLDFKNNSIISNSTNTNIQINPDGTGTIQLLKDTTVTGNLTVTGNINLGGNITIGDQSSDTINFVGSLNNNLIPSATATYNIGSDSLRWRNLYAGKVIVDGIDIDTNVIQSTDSNANLELRANGTGSIRIDQLDIKSNTIVSNSTNTNININPNGTGTIQLQKDTYVTGNLDVTGNINLGGNITIGNQDTDTINLVGTITNNLIPAITASYDIGKDQFRWRNIYGSKMVIDDIEIDTNLIRTTTSNADLEIRGSGTGAVRVDQIDFNDNTIITNTTNTDLLINPNGTGTIQLQKDTYVTGNLDVTGNINLGGNITIGNQTSDTINVIGSISNSLIPSSNGTFDIGSSTNTWRNLYASNLRVNDVEINDNYITTTASNADLELSANGTGVVRITNSNFVANQNVTVSGTANLNNVTITGTFNTPFINVNNTLTASSFFTGDIEISTNVIRTTASNSNLELRANGTGAVYAENLSIQQSNISGLVSGQDIELTPSGTGIVKVNSTQSLQVPVGTDAQRPVSAAAGMLRYNSTVNQYEGYTGTQWVQLGGVSDVDRNTYIKAESSPGANDNTLYFYADGSLAATLTNQDFRPNKILVDDLEINGNVVKTTTTNTDLELRPNGTGALVIDGFRITNNTLLNTNSGAVTEFRSTGTGYYKIVGTNAVVIPAGITSERPGSAQTGMIRYNTGLGFVEVYDGTTWVNIAGLASGITLTQAEEIGLVSALIFG